MRLFILLLLAVTAPQTVVAAIYSWTDAQGQQHFSDDPTLANQHTVTLYQPGKPAASSTPLIRPQSLKKARKETSKVKYQERRPTAADAVNKACLRYERQIDALTIKLRRAHSNLQGNRWREQRRHYQHKRWQDCSD